METIINMFFASGPAVLLVAAGIFWGKNIIEYFFKETVELKKNELNQQLEQYKLNLEKERTTFQHSLNEKLEEHKNKLELIKEEYQIQFSHLHQERATVIKKLYQKLIELQSAMHSFTRTIHPVQKEAEQESKERTKRVNKALMEFQNYYAVNRIFLPKETCSKIDKLLEQYSDKGWDFSYFQNELKLGHLDKEIYMDYYKKCREISLLVKDKFPSLVTEIEDLFREILGDNKK